MFSVIIPLYNKALYIEKAIYSILNQTFQEFEIIVIDDGSTDGSYEIVKKLFEDNKLKPPVGGWQLHTQSNAGVSVTRNRAVAIAKYQYIAFLDADDWWGENYLEEMSRLIKDFPEAALYASSYYSVKYGKNRSAQIGVSDTFDRGYFDYFRTYANSHWMPVTSITAVIRKDIFDKLGGFTPQLKLGEDFHLWARVALDYRMALVNKPLAYYNQDVSLSGRAVGKLHKPEEHMLWNLEFLEKEEKNNPDIKLLLDNLRAYSLLPYYLNKNTCEKAKEELDKVDWEKQTSKTLRKYKLPIWMVKLERGLKRAGVKVKHLIKKINH